MGLAVLAEANILLFHVLAELFSIVVAFGIFIVAWNSRRICDNAFFIHLGIAFLFVGGIDLMHALSYRGMGVVEEDGGNRATELWLAGRYLQSLSFLAALSALGRRGPPRPALLAAYGTLFVAVMAGTFHYDWFPDAYVPGQGLTPFKIHSEYAIIALCLVGAGLILLLRRRLAARTAWLLAAAMLVMATAEAWFTVYVQLDDAAIVAGHFLKVLSFYLIYKATIEAAFVEPYNLLFTNLEAARASLAGSEQRFRLALRSVPVIVFSQNRDLRYTWIFNEGIVELRSEDIAGRVDGDLFPALEAATLVAAKRRVIDSGVSARIEVGLTINGRRHVFDNTLDPVLDGDGRVIGLIGIAIDVTRDRQIQRELRHARAEAERANEAKSRFLAAASHDLRQPLQATHLFLEVLQQRLGGEPGLQVVAGKAVQALTAGEELLDTLLDVSTLEAGIVQPSVGAVHLRRIFAQMMDEWGPQAAAKGVTMGVVPTSAVVRSDAVLLQRILRNLVTNAIRYTGTGTVLLGCRRLDGAVRIEVWDTGGGVPEDKLAIIFEDFVQLHNPERNRNKGLGLGLSIVKRMAQLLDHPVSVRSWPGRGSVFGVTVPLATPADEAVADAEKEAIPA